MKSSRLWNLLIALNLLTGCGYRWEPDYPAAHRPTLTVPFIQGDEEGLLTVQVIEALSQSGLVDIVHAGGDYRLEIAIEGTSNETTGYRRDPQKVFGKVRHNLLAVEARRGMTITATLYRGDAVAGGPFRLAASADYDYVDGDSAQDLTFLGPAGNLVTVLPFSLGQLEPVESAQEAANRPLYSRLAQKIVDAISSTW